jgi:hypothetical protein
MRRASFSRRSATPRARSTSRSAGNLAVARAPDAGRVDHAFVGEAAGAFRRGDEGDLGQDVDRHRAAGEGGLEPRHALRPPDGLERHRLAAVQVRGADVTDVVAAPADAGGGDRVARARAGDDHRALLSEEAQRAARQHILPAAEAGGGDAARYRAARLLGARSPRRGRPGGRRRRTLRRRCDGAGKLELRARAIRSAGGEGEGGDQGEGRQHR